MIELNEGDKLAPMQSKKVVVAVGRFSVPTIGHYRVINAMKHYIRKHASMNLEITPVIVIVDGEKTSKNKKRNPLTPDQRIKFMQASGKANGIKFLIAGNAFDALAKVRAAGYEPIVIAAGDDRANSYFNMLNKYFKDPDDKPIKHYIVPGLERKNGKDITEKSASGTMARLAVELGHFEEFKQITGLDKKEKLAKQMYDTILVNTKEE